MFPSYVSKFPAQSSADLEPNFGFGLSALENLQRQNELQQNIDPFMVLKNMMETSSLMGLGFPASTNSKSNCPDPNFIGYQNYSASISEKFFPQKSSSDALVGVIKNKDIFLKAQANATASKAEWFSRFQSNPSYDMPDPPPKKLKNGLTVDQEIQIGLEMIPMFKAKEEEALQQFEKIMEVKQQLNQFKDELGGMKKKYVQPLASTSFMVRKQTARPVKNKNESYSATIEEKPEQTTKQLANSDLKTIQTESKTPLLDILQKPNMSSPNLGSKLPTSKRQLTQDMRTTSSKQQSQPQVFQKQKSTQYIQKHVPAQVSVNLDQKDVKRVNSAFRAASKMKKPKLQYISDEKDQNSRQSTIQPAFMRKNSNQCEYFNQDMLESQTNLFKYSVGGKIGLKSSTKFDSQARSTLDTRGQKRPRADTAVRNSTKQVNRDVSSRSNSEKHKREPALQKKNPKFTNTSSERELRPESKLVIQQVTQMLEKSKGNEPIAQVSPKKIRPSLAENSAENRCQAQKSLVKNSLQTPANQENREQFVNRQKKSAVLFSSLSLSTVKKKEPNMVKIVSPVNVNDYVCIKKHQEPEIKSISQDQELEVKTVDCGVQKEKEIEVKYIPTSSILPVIKQSSPFRSSTQLESNKKTYNLSPATVRSLKPPNSKRQMLRRIIDEAQELVHTMLEEQNQLKSQKRGWKNEKQSHLRDTVQPVITRKISQEIIQNQKRKTETTARRDDYNEDAQKSSILSLQKIQEQIIQLAPKHTKQKAIKQQELNQKIVQAKNSGGSLEPKQVTSKRNSNYSAAMQESQHMPAINHKNKLESTSYDDGKKVKLNDLFVSYQDSKFTQYDSRQKQKQNILAQSTDEILRQTLNKSIQMSRSKLNLHSEVAKSQLKDSQQVQQDQINNQVKAVLVYNMSNGMKSSVCLNKALTAYKKNNDRRSTKKQQHPQSSDQTDIRCSQVYNIPKLKLSAYQDLKQTVGASLTVSQSPYGHKRFDQIRNSQPNESTKHIE